MFASSGRDPKLTQKHLIISAVRSRRYKKDNNNRSSSKNGIGVDSPKTLFTRNLMNIYKGASQNNPISNSSNH